MKRFVTTLIILLAICAAFFYALSWPRGLGDERAVGGVLDLTGADFSQTRHNLDGEWEFYFGALYTPEDFARGAVSAGTLINVPGSWTDAGYPIHGSATYRLVVKTNEPSLMMFLTVISNASAVWINGEKVFTSGTVGEQTLQAGGVANGFVSFYPQNGRVEIIAQASNYAFFRSGILTGIEIGRPQPVLTNIIFRRVLLGLFIGVLLAMFIYQLFLFSGRRKEWAHLAFALFCIVTAARFVLETNGLAMLFTDNGHIERSIFQVLISLKAVGLVIFTYYFFNISVGKIALCVYVTSMGIPILTAIFLPFDAVDSRIAFLPMISLIGMIVAALRSKQLHSSYYNYLYLNVCFFYIIAQPIERFLLDGQIYMLAATHNLLMVLVQFFMLSLSYSQAREAEQRLAAENAALENLSRMKSNFLMEMSHEMKSPLGVMDGYAQLTVLDIDEGTASEDTKENLRKISKEARRLVSLVNRLLDIAAEAPLTAGIIRVTVEDAINRAITLCEPILAQNNNKTAVKIEKNCPPVSANPETLMQVLMNLLNNANRQINGGIITITAAPVNNMVRFEIQDGGKGIPPALLSRVFERGVSGDGSTGLGLHICKEAIAAHGGTIKIESPVPGTDNGTRASFTLPVFSMI